MKIKDAPRLAELSSAPDDPHPERRPAPPKCAAEATAAAVTAVPQGRRSRLRFRLCRDFIGKLGRDLGMGRGIEVDVVPLIIVGRDLRVEDDDANVTRAQPLHHCLDVGGALLLRETEAEIIAARLQNDDVGALGRRVVEAAQHARGRVAENPGVGNLGGDALLAQKDLQLRGIGILRTDTETGGIAGADRDDVEDCRLEWRRKEERENEQDERTAHPALVSAISAFRRRVARGRVRSRVEAAFGAGPEGSFCPI